MQLHWVLSVIISFSLSASPALAYTNDPWWGYFPMSSPIATHEPADAWSYGGDVRTWMNGQGMDGALDKRVDTSVSPSLTLAWVGTGVQLNGSFVSTQNAVGTVIGTVSLDGGGEQDVKLSTSTSDTQIFFEFTDLDFAPHSAVLVLNPK
jgi:hypothetical protein